MRLNRTLLYTGVFLVAIGSAVVAADLLSTAALIDLLRLWPVAVIAIGLGIALRRTQLSLVLLAIVTLILEAVVFALGLGRRDWESRS